MQEIASTFHVTSAESSFQCLWYQTLDEQKRDDICLFSERLERVWLLLWVVPHHYCSPGDSMACHESHCFPLGIVAWETHEQDFIKGAVIFITVIYTAFTIKSAFNSVSVQQVICEPSQWL